MDPFTLPDELLNSCTQLFSIERNNSIIGRARGFFCGDDPPKTIQLVENTDVKNGDWIIDSITEQRYYACDAQPILVNGKPHDWQIRYQTEQEFQHSIFSHSQTNINIQSVNGNSVIGSQERVTINVGHSLSDIETLLSKFPSPEQSEARELIEELRRTETSAHPILVQGAWSKFSDLLKKHTDLATAIGGWAVQLLIGK